MDALAALGRKQRDDVIPGGRGIVVPHVVANVEVLQGGKHIVLLQGRCVGRAALHHLQGVAAAGAEAPDDREQLNTGSTVEFPVFLPAAPVGHRAAGSAGVAAPIAIEDDAECHRLGRETSAHPNQRGDETQHDPGNKQHRTART